MLIYYIYTVHIPSLMVTVFLNIITRYSYYDHFLVTIIAVICLVVIVTLIGLIVLLVILNDSLIVIVIVLCPVPQGVVLSFRFLG